MALSRGTYKSWKAMIYRCTRPHTMYFNRYGGRGILVCERWLDDYDAFVEDMGFRPEGMTIERIDNNGNYEPGNCRWATRAEQDRNRRDNRFLTANGKTQTISEWARELGVTVAAIRARLKLHPVELSLSRVGPQEAWGLSKEIHYDL